MRVVLTLLVQFKIFTNAASVLNLYCENFSLGRKRRKYRNKEREIKEGKHWCVHRK